MPLANEDRNALNRDAQTVINFIGVAQQDYFNKHGEYFQLLVTPEIPFDMSQLQPLSVRHPSDERWVEDKITTFVTNMPFQVEVMDHNGGSNEQYRGYSIRFMATVGPETYHRVVRQPDNTDTDWYLYVEPSLD